NPFCAGLLGVNREMLRHTNYLLGEVRVGRGWWYYFPLAMLFKTPLATLVAIAIAAALLISRRLELTSQDRQVLVCMAVAILVYVASAMMQSINHGVRHMLPVYVLIAIAVGVLIARAL